MKIYKILFVLFLCQINNVYSQCWISSYGRGVGAPISICNDDQEKDGALCYPKCQPGFDGVGPVCWQMCQPGFNDIGAICSRGPHIYGKGCCCVRFLWFNRCCGNCPSGYNDDGCTCRRLHNSYPKNSYGRGAGYPLKCKNDEQYDAGLCYPYCQNGYKGVGPVCWLNSCSGVYGYSCGLMCTVDKQQCMDVNSALAKTSIDIVKSITNLIASGGSNPQAWLSFFSKTVDLSSTLINDVCDGSNKTASNCFKSINDGVLSTCSGNNPIDCGLFCASSKIQCAKEITKIVSIVLDISKTFIFGDTQNAQAKANFESVMTEMNLNFQSLIDLIKQQSTFLANIDFSLAQQFITKFINLIQTISNIKYTVC